ncbi:NUDIX domain-containing protein [Streptomyces cinerochromogenes]|uniref:NUDIX domain-containing protein n=1 Tax=Streptomyces cinerochromogenes TaxID=66422 RepID=UPI003699AAD4
MLSRRAGDLYAAGCRHLPSGHLDGPCEHMVTALLRETREETGVVVDHALRPRDYPPSIDSRMRSSVRRPILLIVGLLST